MSLARTIVCLVLIALAGCDDGNGETSPDSEPEPEPPFEMPLLAEARMLDADGDLLFRDVYFHQDDRLSAFTREDHEGQQVANFLMDYDEAGRLSEVTASLSLTTFFQDRFGYGELPWGGGRFIDTEPTALVFEFELTEAGLVRSVHFRRQSETLARDEVYERDGAPSTIVRYSSDGEVLAALAMSRNEAGQVIRVDVSAPLADDRHVEFDYDTELTAPPADAITWYATTILYPLTEHTGAPIVLSEPDAE